VWRHVGIRTEITFVPASFQIKQRNQVSRMRVLAVDAVAVDRDVGDGPVRRDQ
jgi:hypothetical protein